MDGRAWSPLEDSTNETDSLISKFLLLYYLLISLQCSLNVSLLIYSWGYQNVSCPLHCAADSLVLSSCLVYLCFPSCISCLTFFLNLDCSVFDRSKLCCFHVWFFLVFHFSALPCILYFVLLCTFMLCHNV